MTDIPNTPEAYAGALRKAVSTFKAALVVSAAAILSQGQGDLEANASAATGHLDDMLAQLRTVCDVVRRQDAVDSGETTRAIDGNLLDLLIGVVEDRTARLRDALYAVVGHPERDGLEAFVAAAGEAGTAVDELVALLTGPPAADATPFRYDQFFLESMQDLAQRDWTAS
jgi:hypothetical protein